MISTLTWIIHVHEQPLHRSIRVTVPRGKQRLLTPDHRKAHALQLSHGLGVECHCRVRYHNRSQRKLTTARSSGD